MYIYKWQINNRYCINFKIVTYHNALLSTSIYMKICYVLLIYLNYNFNNTYTDQTGRSRASILD
jgi:hypothetical protein